MLNGLLNSSLSFSKVLYGLSKTITVYKNIKPLYDELSPVIKKIPELLNKLPTFTANINSNNTFNTTEIKENPTTNGPVFFT